MGLEGPTTRPKASQRSPLLSRGGRVGGGAWRAGAGPAGGGRSCRRLDSPGRGLGWDPAGAMELLSALSLGELALSFSRVPLFPVFDLSYFIVSILYLKYEPGEPGPEAGEDWHSGARDGGLPRGLEKGKGLNRGGTVPGTGLGKQAGAGIMGFSHTGPDRGERQERGQGEKLLRLWRWGRGSRCRLEERKGM